MDSLYQKLIKAKERGYWGVKKNDKKNTFTHTLYYKEIASEYEREIPVLEFETPIDTEYYDFYYPIKIYIEPIMNLKGCIKIKDEIKLTGLEEFKKIVMNKILEIHDDIEIELKY